MSRKDANTLRKEYDELMNTIGKNYELRDLSGTNKQLGWAYDIRIRFTKSVESKRKTMDLNDFIWIYTNILIGVDDASWWIENKNIKLTDVLQTIKNNNSVTKEQIESVPPKLLDKQYDAHTNTTKQFTLPNINLNNLQPKQQPLPSVVTALQNKRPSNVVIINKTDKTKIEIICDKELNIQEIFPDIEFTSTATGYCKEISDASIEYDGIINNISLTLLNLGKQVKIENNTQKHDSTVDCVITTTSDGRIVAKCRTEATYKAMRRIGEITVDITNANKEEIYKLTQHYNIKIEKEVESFLNETM